MSFFRFQGYHPGNGREDRLRGNLLWGLYHFDCWAFGLHGGKGGEGRIHWTEGTIYFIFYRIVFRSGA